MVYGGETEWSFSTIVLQLPWERVRSFRLLNKLTAEKLAQCNERVGQLAAGGFVALPSDVKLSPELNRDITYQHVRTLVRPDEYFVNGREYGMRQLGDCLEVEVYRRATRLIMAVEAWKLEHGALPKALADLTDKKYLEQLPVDPYTGRAFRYEPHGIAGLVVWGVYYSPENTLEPGRPFLSCDTWSARPRQTFSEDEPRPPKGHADAGPSKPEVWRDVWVFPIP